MDLILLQGLIMCMCIIMNKKISYIFLVVCLFFLLLSCNKTKNLQVAMEEFMGSEIEFLEEWPLREEVGNRLVIWFDSTECGSCRMSRLYEWNDDPVMHYAQGLKDKFEVLLIFSPKKQDVRSLKFNLEGYDVSFPVIIDEAGDFPRLNPHIPADTRLHSFLLDKDNKVVLVGNPLGNEQLWELYKEQIRQLVNAQ